jgi:hypothetical protein
MGVVKPSNFILFFYGFWPLEVVKPSPMAKTYNLFIYFFCHGVVEPPLFFLSFFQFYYCLFFLNIFIVYFFI